MILSGTDILLTAILPDTPSIQTKSFGVDSEGALAWAQDLNARGFNIYWTPNEVAPGTSKKPIKKDITRVRFAHADVDPPKNSAHWNKDQIINEMYVAGATIIIDSGNGLQALWAFYDAPTQDVAEMINDGLVTRWCDDRSTRNIDRLLRLPGTINYPNARKQKDGRVKTTSNLVFFDPERMYESQTLLASFPPPANLENKHDDIDFGDWEIETVNDPEILRLIETPKGRDRSNDVLLAAAAMQRKAYSPEKILGVLMNPVYAVHNHIAEQPYPERAAKRAVRRTMESHPTNVFEAPEKPLEETVVETTDDFPAYIAGYFYPEYFKGCVWINTLEQIFTPDGRARKKPAFDTMYGGKIFVMDHEGQKTSDSAWDAFRLSKTWRPPIAESVCFKPDLEPGALIEYEGETYYNTWVPAKTQCEPGDVTPFLNLLQTLLPIENDRKILLHWMASMVQNPGKKFQWWPVIQGAEGNGKTFISTMMERAVGRRYFHLINPESLAKTGNQFNSWVEQMLLVVLEEINIGQRKDLLDILKPVVTNKRNSVEKKGKDQYAGDNVVNGIILTNHKNGVPIDKSSRRYCIFYTAQQEVEDIERDGLGGSYFPKLYDWAEKEGYAYLTHYLRTYPLEAELDPARLCHRAPKTSSFDQALIESLGTVDQEVVEAIEQGRPGFAGGWVSSQALTILVQSLRARMSPRARRELLDNLGYVKHPGLPDGRSPRSVAPDNTKTRLYIKRGHLASQLTDIESILAEYTSSQVASELSGQTGTVTPLRPTK